MNDKKYPDALEELIGLLKNLPGIGRRGAERVALAILKWPDDKRAALGAMIGTLAETITFCPECGAIAERGALCRTCSDPRRDETLLCVVEEPQQIFAIEQSGHYHGLYHVLGGRLSPLDAQNGESLSTARLLERASSGKFREVILALSADVEGRATAIYLGELLHDAPVRVSQPALGLPAGSNLGYADPATISAALAGRRTIKDGE